MKRGAVKTIQLFTEAAKVSAFAFAIARSTDKSPWKMTVDGKKIPRRRGSNAEIKRMRFIIAAVLLPGMIAVADVKIEYDTGPSTTNPQAANDTVL